MEVLFILVFIFWVAIAAIKLLWVPTRAALLVIWRHVPPKTREVVSVATSLLFLVAIILLVLSFFA